MRLLLLGALALGFCAAAVEGPVIIKDTGPSGEADMEQLQGRIAAMMDDLRIRLARLKDIQEIYSDERRVPEVEAERGVLVAGLVRDLERMDSLETAYSNAFTTQDRVLKARTFTLISKGQGIPLGAVNAVAASYGHTEFLEQARAFRRKARSDMTAEEVSFGVSRDACQSRQLLYRFAAAAVLLIAILAAALFLARKRGTLLLLALFLPASSSWSAQPSEEDVERALGEMSRVMDETAPLLQRLEILKDACQEASSFESCSQERRVLRAEVETKMKRLHDLQYACDAARETKGWNALFTAVGAAKARRVVPVKVGVDFLKNRSLRESAMQASAFRKHADEQLAREAEAFAYAENLAATRRLYKTAAGVLAALLLLALGAWRLAARLLRPSRAPAPGAVLGKRYRLGCELGGGVFGALYEADDLELRSKAALRLLAGPRSRALEPHPNIVRELAAFKDDGQSYQVFELGPGRPLSAWLENGRRLPLASVKRVARQAADALAFAHSRGVVHGGLKPSKLLLAPDLSLKLRDFGRPRPDSVHAAPEVVAGSPALPASDLFSLGALLYHGLTGRPPYETLSLELRRKKLFIPPTELVAGLAAAADAFFQRALAPGPEDRFASPGELADAVERLPG